MRGAALLFVCLVSGAPVGGVQPAAAPCGSWRECRDLALGAAARGEYEAFHDLAWRAVQQGPRNSPALMVLLARAQSLSGRPHDALVMLQRLLELGVLTDADESEDFRRVRALAAWPAFEQQVAERRAAGGVMQRIPESPVNVGASGGGPPSLPREGTARRDSVAGPKRAPLSGIVPFITARALPPPALRLADEPVPDDAVRAAGDKPTDRAPAGAATDALRFSNPSFSPTGLAHDAASNRFVLADRRDRRLAVIGAHSRRLSNLAGAESAGFGDIAGLAIDAREGDLWVISESDEPAMARLHRLQLISGRVLHEIRPPEDHEAARFADISVAPGGGVLVLDAGRRRILRVAPKSRSLVRAAEVDRDGLASIAPASATLAYVAHAEGIASVDLAAGRAGDVVAASGLDLSGVSWIRYRRSSLVAVQRAGEGRYRLVRFHLDAAGRRITRETVLEPEVATSGPPPAVISGDTLYYLAEVPAPDFSGAAEVIVRSVPLKP